MVAKAFDLISFACENIKDHNACGECPRRHMCLDDTEESIITFADLMSAESWDEFLAYADVVTFTDEDIEAQRADDARKAAIEDEIR